MQDAGVRELTERRGGRGPACLELISRALDVPRLNKPPVCNCAMICRMTGSLSLLTFRAAAMRSSAADVTGDES